MNEIKVGIAGLGRSGLGIHARVFEKLSDLYKVVSVLDPIEERRQEAMNRFGCKAYSDFVSFIEDDEAELIVIATPSYLHAPQTIKSLKAGKKVVCEKPMATNLADVDAMIETSEITGNLLTIFQEYRYAPDFLKVKEVLQSEHLGRIVLIKMSWHLAYGRSWDWQSLKKFGGGILNDTGPHALDQALQLFGDKEPEIFCDLQRALTLGDAEDHVKIILKANGAPTIDIEITRACAYPQSWWLIMGTRGGLTGENKEDEKRNRRSSLEWKYFDPEDLPPRQVGTEPVAARSFRREEIPWKETSWNMGENTDNRQGEITFYDELYKTLKYGTPLGITPKSVRRVMQVIEKCRASCEVQRNRV